MSRVEIKSDRRPGLNEIRQEIDLKLSTRLISEIKGKKYVEWQPQMKLYWRVSLKPTSPGLLREHLHRRKTPRNQFPIRWSSRRIRTPMSCSVSSLHFCAPEEGYNASFKINLSWFLMRVWKFARSIKSKIGLYQMRRNISCLKNNVVSKIIIAIYCVEIYIHMCLFRINVFLTRLKVFSIKIRKL